MVITCFVESHVHFSLLNAVQVTQHLQVIRCIWQKAQGECKSWEHVELACVMCMFVSADDGLLF